MKTEKQVTRATLNAMLDEISKVRAFHAEASKHFAEAEKSKSPMTDFFKTAVNSSRADLEFNAASFGRKISALISGLDESKLRELVASLPIPAK